ncbi:YeiH family protein, partial [Burkholderia contaminans]|nr:YeiH family protein [Burkholderia contaminans]
MDTKLATLIGVGSSICGGSAIAATAPVIHAKEKEVA